LLQPAAGDGITRVGSEGRPKSRVMSWAFDILIVTRQNGSGPCGVAFGPPDRAGRAVF